MESIQKQLQAACDDMGGECELRDNYSGRAMYGKRCIGITGSMRDCQKVIASVLGTMSQDLFDTAINCDDSDREATAAYDLNDKVQEAIDSLMAFSWDSMGLDVIVYWPDIEPEEAVLPTDEWIDKQSERTLLEFVSENSEYHTDEDDVENLTALRATVKLMRDRMEEDHE
jgi:hypothetical protein